MTSTKPPPSQLQIWLLAARPKTLPAAAAPVVVGAAIAVSDQAFRLGPALAALVGALLLQIGANLANDVFDFKKGADAAGRLGPLRVTQAGLLTPRQVLLGMWLTFGLAALAGVYLIVVAGWPIVVIGLLSIASAIAYTGGPFPLGYKGLGDLFVFIFFGLVAVCGTYYVQAGAVSLAALWASIPIGVLTVAILVVNNLRDLETDRASGKKTLAVRLGAHGARLEYLLMLGIAYAAPLLRWLVAGATPWALLAWLSLPVAWPIVRLVLTGQGRALNRALADTARLELIYAVLFSAGVIIGA
ncbi:MAG: 1,4-dihydroxy-2-naphthoate polyprenyltransferase [Chloroflexota bacterium]